VSTSLLVSAGAVSCYPALMVNLIWFANEKCSSCQHLATWGHEIRHLAIQKCNNLQAWCASTLFCSNMKKSSYPHSVTSRLAKHI